MKLLRCLAGPHAGQLIEYDDHVAEALLSTGQAEVAEEEPVVREPEVAVVPPGETAEKPRRKKRKHG